MKIYVVFDAYAESYQVSDRAAELSKINGVISIETMERVAGKVPRYCLAIEIENENAQETGDQLKRALGEYSSYMSNVVWGAFRKIG
jgi:hypothetical protein